MELPGTIAQRGSEFLLFALTPPRASVSSVRAQEIADVTVARLAPVGVDGLILYDIADESDRTPADRPFPFLPTMDPSTYLDRHLAAWTGSVIVYRSVGKYRESDLGEWLSSHGSERIMTVFVGTPSRTSTPVTSLPLAQAVWASKRPAVPLGGVAIPERHTRRGDEHLRLLDKQAAGCSFFVTQVVYDLDATKDMVSDYFYECVARDVLPAPIVFTFTVVGSRRTLDFLDWLGVRVPRWIRNDIVNAADPLALSSQHARAAAAEMASFCRNLGVPFGLNVESVSSRRAEVDAAVALAHDFSAILDRPGEEVTAPR